MDNGLYVTGSRMNGLAEQLQVVAANVANSNSTGFKRMVDAFRADLHGVAEGADTSRAPLWPQLQGAHLDMTPGAIVRTGRPLDLAIRGEAFFEVQTPEGPRYTRKGRLYLNRAGELTDREGHPYGADGGSLSIPEGSGPVTVLADGEVLAEEQSLGRLRMVEIPDTEALQPVGAGLYRYDGSDLREATDSEIIQGSVEQSNVKPMEEMVLLINIMRAYEASSRLLRKMDGLGNELIRSAG